VAHGRIEVFLAEIVKKPGLIAFLTGFGTLPRSFIVWKLSFIAREFSFIVEKLSFIA